MGNKYDYRQLREFINANHDRFSELNFDSSMSMQQKMNALVEWFKVMLKEYNDWIEYLDDFKETFDSKLYNTLEDILLKWLEDGLLEELIRASINDEVVTARKPFDLPAYPTLGERLDKQIGLDTDFRPFDINQSFMKRVYNDFEERSVNIKWFGAIGNGIVNDTAAIQNTINYAASKGLNVYIPNGSWLVSHDDVRGYALSLPSNTSVICGEGAVLELEKTDNPGYVMVSINDVNNVKWVNGKLIGDVGSHIGTGGEWGMGFHLVKAKNVLIKDTSADKCWGDGFYVGGSGYENHCENITLDNCSADGNRRQGLSVINVDGLYIPNTFTGRNTKGTAPQACVDFEPNKNGEILKNIKINKIVSENNEGPAVLVVLKALNPQNEGFNLYQSKNQVDITIDDVSSKNDYQGLSFYGTALSEFNVDGVITIGETTVISPKNHGFFQDQWREKNYPPIFIDSLTIVDAKTYGLRQAILLPDNSTADDIWYYGGLNINNLNIIDNSNKTDIGIMLQYPGGNRRLRSNINNYQTNLPLIKTAFYMGHDGIVNDSKVYPVTSVIAGDRLLNKTVLWGITNSIQLPVSDFQIGKKIKVYRSPELALIEPLVVVVNSESNDYLYSTSKTIPSGRSKKMVFDSKTKMFEIQCVAKNMWVVIGGEAREDNFAEYNGIIYSASKPTNTDFPVGVLCLNKIPRISMPIGWVLIERNNVKEWFDLQMIS